MKTGASTQSMQWQAHEHMSKHMKRNSMNARGRANTRTRASTETHNGQAHGAAETSRPPQAMGVAAPELHSRNTHAMTPVSKKQPEQNQRHLAPTLQWSTPASSCASRACSVRKAYSPCTGKKCCGFT
eukprot:240322-Pelagomonas_calceolata.AAC.1